MVSKESKSDFVTYMNRPVSLLHVISREDIGYTGQPVQETILESKHGSRPDNRCLREDAANNSFSLGLFKVLVSVVMIRSGDQPLSGRTLKGNSGPHCVRRHE